MNRRLYLQIYLGFVTLVLTLTVVALTWHWAMHRNSDTAPKFFDGVVTLVGDQLPPPGAPRAELEAVLSREADRLGVVATLWDGADNHILSTGRRLGPVRQPEQTSEWLRGRDGPPGLAVRLDDGRRLALALKRERHEHAMWGAGFLLVAAIIAAGAYPLSRRITGRLERLRVAVDLLGTGDMSSRVPVEGRDEVADLANSFNRTADRLEALLIAERRVLASASHELRSPLARLRVAVELMESRDPKLREEAEADIAELDALIEDVLLSARIEAGSSPAEFEPIDFLGLVVEEASRAGADAEGAPATVRGDRRTLARLLRNLLDNARKHGGNGEVSVSVNVEADGVVRLAVADRGPGIPSADRDRVFEPFYRRAGHSEERDGGVGLGLALVREIARHHGGDAECRAREGGGTVVEVTLPSC